jgi:CRISPR-associated protein Cas2
VIVLVLDKARPALRGQISRWLMEVKPGIFVGTVSARVRDAIWAMIRARHTQGGALLVARARNEQGFVMESHGAPTRQVFDIDGLTLIRRLDRHR